MKRKANHSAGRLGSAGGFTLVELLVVVAVIGILAAMTYAAINSAIGRAKKASTLALISALNTGIQNFRTDFGHVPYDKDDGTGEITNEPEWIRLWLLGIDNNGEPDGTIANKSSRAVRRNALWNGPYVEVREKSLDPDQQYIFVDSWNKPIYFEMGNADPNQDHRVFNVDRWDIWSLGADGKGTTDMSTISGGTYEAKRSNYKQLVVGGKRVNFDNPANWQ